MSYIKVVSWLWRENRNKPKREDAYHYDDQEQTIVITRGTQTPEESKEMLPAIAFWESYKAKGREKLTKHGKVMYDFLKDIGYN
jgi:hypothetical protein